MARIQFVSATLVFGLAAFDCSLAISSSHTSLGVLYPRSFMGDVYKRQAEDRAVDLGSVLFGAGRAEEGGPAPARIPQAASHGLGPASLSLIHIYPASVSLLAPGVCSAHAEVIPTEGSSERPIRCLLRTRGGNP